jgi:hypothetical protein
VVLGGGVAAGGCWQAGEGTDVEPARIGTAAGSASIWPKCVTIRRGVLGIVDDAHLVASWPTKNYGGSGSLSVGTLNGAARKALVRFDLGEITKTIPPGHATTVLSATARFTTFAAGGPATLDLHRVNALWSESSVTWQSFFTTPGTPSADEIAATLALPGGTPQGAPLAADLTALVQQWVNGVDNQGVLIEAASPGAAAVSFRSSEHPDGGPSLDVCFAPQEHDGLKNGRETDVDCGGPTADGCGANGACADALDCSDHVDNASLCRVPWAPGAGPGNAPTGMNACLPPTCADGVRNGTETGVDCGGDPSCPRCGDDDHCIKDTDCLSGECEGSRCVPSASGPDGGGSTASKFCEGQLDGTPCDDLDRCTRLDACKGGTCQGVAVECLPVDPCHPSPICDGTTGHCVAGSPAANGTACSDGNYYTAIDTCQAGVCVGQNNYMPGCNPGVCTTLWWVGASPTTHYPVVPAGHPAGPWTLIKPFPAGLSPALDRYCFYQWAGGPGTSPTQNQTVALGSFWGSDPINAAAGVQPLTQDCGSIGALGLRSEHEWLEQGERAELRPIFEDQAGVVHPGSGLGAPAQTTLVEVVDTAPRLPQLPLWSPHGPLLAALIHDLTCADPAHLVCAADVQKRLGLPMHDDVMLGVDPFAPDAPHGGRLGTPLQLAVAVARAVKEWVPGANPHLVLNLSVGAQPSQEWATLKDPGHGGPSWGPLALYEALRVAACKGALAIAASGNKLGGPNPPFGPAYPAAWSQSAPPSVSDCQGLLTDPFTLPSAPGAILYAASGIDSQGRPLTNAIPGSVAPFAAIGSLMTASDGSELPPPMTGSSAAAAVTSAAAAMVWAYQPNLTADEVMQIVYNSGKPLGRTADLSAPTFGAHPVVRRVSVTGALHQACAVDPAAPGCASFVPATCPFASPQDPATCFPLAPSLSCGVAVGLLSLAPPSGATLSPGTSPAPFDQYQNVSSPGWVRPFPIEPVCPQCTISVGSPGAQIYISIDERSVDAMGVAVLSAGVTVYQSGAPAQSYNVAGPLKAGNEYVFELAGPFTTTVDKAEISFAVQDLRSGSIGSTFESMIVR